jgi:hypothetical protein
MVFGRAPLGAKGIAECTGGSLQKITELDTRQFRPPETL